MNNYSSEDDTEKTMNSEFSIRRARADEREELMDLLHGAFSRPGFQIDFTKTHPFLFHQDRIPNHFLCFDGDTLIGNIGMYTYNVRVGGEIFKAAGIGQVACRAEYRGKGVMSSILKRICEEMIREEIDFSWLYGDRLRYGRYGWVKGGKTLTFEIYDKYLPPPPQEGEVRLFNSDLDIDLLKKHLNGLYVMQILTDRDIRDLISRKEYIGYVLGTAFIIVQTGSDTVVFASGTSDQIAMLLSFYGREIRKRDGDFWKFSVVTVAQKTPLMRVCERSFWQVQAVPSGMFRIGCLLPFLEKVCRIKTGNIPLVPGELALKNSDTGEEATLVSDEISLSVKAGAENPIELNSRELSEVFFGWCPIDLFIPSLPGNSSFRSVLPFHFHLPKFLAV